MTTTMDELCVNTIRTLAMDAVQRANSGHPGTPMALGHLIQWFGRHGPEAEVSAYFTPGEWWRMGGDRIVQEIQQVYLNFVTAIGSGARPPRRLDVSALPALDPEIAGMTRAGRGRRRATTAG